MRITAMIVCMINIMMIVCVCPLLYDDYYWYLAPPLQNPPPSRAGVESLTSLPTPLIRLRPRDAETTHQTHDWIWLTLFESTRNNSSSLKPSFACSASPGGLKITPTNEQWRATNAANSRSKSPRSGEDQVPYRHLVPTHTLEVSLRQRPRVSRFALRDRCLSKLGSNKRCQFNITTQRGLATRLLHYIHIGNIRTCQIKPKSVPTWKHRVSFARRPHPTTINIAITITITNMYTNTSIITTNTTIIGY